MLTKEQPRSFLNQVTMIESKFERNQPKKKVNLPATLFNRSPLRERMNPVNEMINKSPKRSGLSPLRSRKLDGSGGIFPPHLSNNLGKGLAKSSRTPNCDNHPNKLATHFITSDNQEITYCQKCAISLASQGFRLTRFNDSSLIQQMGSPSHQRNNPTDPLTYLENHPRRHQISAFLEQLQDTSDLLGKKKSEADGLLRKSKNSYQQQKQRLAHYYDYLIAAIQNHRNQAMEGLNKAKVNSESEILKTLETMKNLTVECDTMRQDILDSVQVIKQVDERSFRQVMDIYHSKSAEYRETTMSTPIRPVPICIVSFNDVEEVTARVCEEMIQVHFEEDELNQGVSTLAEKKSSVYFSFDHQQAEVNDGNGVKMLSPNNQEHYASENQGMNPVNFQGKFVKASYSTVGGVKESSGKLGFYFNTSSNNNQIVSGYEE